MSIGIKAVERLTQKNTIFKSPRIKDLTMVNSRYFNKTNTLLTPDIESIKIQKGRDTVVEFSSKKFSNGNLFEVYRLNNEIIKVPISKMDIDSEIIIEIFKLSILVVDV